MTRAFRILVADDELALVDLVRETLKRDGFTVLTARTSEEALGKVRQEPPDLVLLDVRFPTVGGMEVCRQIKSDPRTASIPVIMLTVQSAEEDKVAGLELGADDYITKPFGRREFVARIRAALRRAGRGEPPPPILRAAGIEVNQESREARVRGKPVNLRKAEFDLLCFFLERRNKVLTRAVITEAILGYDYPGEARSVDTHIYNLRRKLGPAGSRIATVLGVGYKFSSD